VVDSCEYELRRAVMLARKLVGRMVEEEMEQEATHAGIAN
jgi:hypothetical protein